MARKKPAIDLAALLAAHDGVTSGEARITQPKAPRPREPQQPKPKRPTKIGPIAPAQVPTYNALMAAPPAPDIDGKPWLQDPDGLYYYDHAAAQRVVDFFAQGLVHVKGDLSGQPLALDPWQIEEVIKPFFGWKKKSDSTRRFRTLYLEVARKAGKSTLIAGLGLYFLFADGEKGPEVYSAAADKDQAKIVFSIAAEMCQKNKDLNAISTCNRDNIYCALKSGFYRALSSDAFSKHGLNASAILFDELHAQQNRELYDVLTTSVGARTQPAVILITTAGTIPAAAGTSICWDMHQHALKVRDGVVRDATFLPVVFDTPIDADWLDEKVWARANPGLGRSVRIDYLREASARAQQIAGYENTFRRLHLSQWTKQETRWISLDKWDACGHDYSESDLLGQECYAGLDLANRNDLAALVLAFPQPNGDFRLLSKFWCPQEQIMERAKKDRVPYDLWAKAGYIIATPGNAIDNEYIRETIYDLGKKFRIKEIAFDPWAATETSVKLSGEGIKMVEFRQGFRSLSEPTKRLYSLILDAKLHHDRNPVLRWMASNAAVEEDAAGNLKPSKTKSSEKIDGIVAATMAIGRATAAPAAVTSVYASRGVRSL